MKEVVVISRMGTEYTVRLVNNEECIVSWVNDDGSKSSDIQDKETVVEHLNDGSWKVIDLR